MRRFVPFLALLTVALGSGTGAAAGLELGDRSRARAAAEAKAAAEARERAAVAAYRQALTPLVGAVNDAVHDAEVADTVDSVTRDDLLTHGGAQAALKAPGDRLRTLPVPVSLVDQSTALLDAYRALDAAVAMLVRGAGSARGRHTPTLVLDGFDALGDGAQQWEEALLSVFGNSQDGHAADRAGRSPATAYILSSSQPCFRGVTAAADVQLSTRAQLLRNGNRVADAFAATVTSLRAVRYEPSATKAHQVHELLAQAGAIAPAMRDGVTAVRRYDRAGALSAQARLRAALKASDRVAQLYEQIGVSWCSVFFRTETKRPTTVGA